MRRKRALIAEYVHFTARLPREIVTELDRIAAEELRSRSSLIEVVLKRFVEQEVNEHRPDTANA